MKTYLSRIIDAEMERALGSAGAVFLKGPRACGKSSTARQFAKSMIQLDRDSAEVNQVRMLPRLGVEGERPRLIDEWQAVPAIWNEVRHAVDEEEGKGLFILTGSATPDTVAHQHSGAGRIRTLVMRTMSLAERHAGSRARAGTSTHADSVSLAAIADGTQEPSAGTDATVSDYANWIVASGFPEFFDADPLDAQDELESYVGAMSEHDYVEIGGARRDPRRFHSFLRAYATMLGQPATLASITRRIGELTGAAIPAAETVTTLHDFATRLFLIEDQPAWSPRMRSKTAMVQLPKRHLADPGLAAALLGASPTKLLSDLETFGMFFESQAVHDLRVYSQHLRARGVFHLRDSKGRDEIDIVVELRDSGWLGFEVKLSHHNVDAAAEHLQRVATKVEQPPCALAVVIPSGPAYQRPDGVWVVPLAALTP